MAKSIEQKIAEQEAALAQLRIQAENAELVDGVRAIKAMLLKLAPKTGSGLGDLVSAVTTALTTANINGDIITVSPAQYDRLHSLRGHLSPDVCAVIDSIGKTT